jgi:hypothetical protein
VDAPPSADAVHPVVVIREAAARPTDVGRPYGFHRFDNIRPDPPDVRDGGFFSHPVTAIHTAAQMFGKMAIDMPVNPVPRISHIDPAVKHGLRLRFVGCFICFICFHCRHFLVHDILSSFTEEQKGHGAWTPVT